MKRIMLVCHGNICRSPMAEFMLKYMLKVRSSDNDYEIASSATSTEELGNPIHYGTRQKLIEKSIPFSERRAVQLKKSDYDKYDLFICMDRNNIRNAGRIFGSDSDSKLRLLMEYAGESRDVADPWFTHNFDETYKDIKKGLEGLIKALENEE